MATGDPPRYEHAPSWDYGAWESDKYGYASTGHRLRGDSPTDAEREILFRLNRLEQIMSMMYKFVEDADAERKFLRIKNAELEKFKASYVPGSLPESSPIPQA